MNPKRQTVEQAIMDLRDHQKALRIMSKQYKPSVYDPEVESLMAELYDERMNIVNRLFVVTQSSGIQLPNPNSRYYDPNPVPVFNVEDFQDYRRNKPLSYPVIIGNLTKYLDHIDYTMITIDRFIEQLERKLKRRQDLQENNIMKLTEEKLKQMILDEMKSNLSISDQDELNADIQLVRDYSVVLDAIRKEEDRIYASGEAERLSDYNKREQEKAELDRKVDAIAKKYGIRFYRYGQPGNKYLIDKLRRKFRRKSL